MPRPAYLEWKNWLEYFWEDPDDAVLRALWDDALHVGGMGDTSSAEFIHDWLGADETLEGGGRSMKGFVAAFDQALLRLVKAKWGVMPATGDQYTWRLCSQFWLETFRLTRDHPLETVRSELRSHLAESVAFLSQFTQHSIGDYLIATYLSAIASPITYSFAYQPGEDEYTRVLEKYGTEEVDGIEPEPWVLLGYGEEVNFQWVESRGTKDRVAGIFALQVKHWLRKGDDGDESGVADFTSDYHYLRSLGLRLMGAMEP